MSDYHVTANVRGPVSFWICADDIAAAVQQAGKVLAASYGPVAADSQLKVTRSETP